jgi:uncharacterized protein CbrC (UPF0167 family)
VIPTKEQIISAIDEVETLKQFGYHPSSLKQCSEKSVILRCPTCSKLFERMYKTVKASVYCFSCSRHTKPISDSVLSAVNTPETLSAFGYSPNTLLRTSHSFVVVNCSFCGNLFRRRFYQLMASTYCKKCGQPGNRVLVSEDITTAINIIATIDRLNYHPNTLSPNSIKHVVINCIDCGELVTRQRNLLITTLRCKSCGHKNCDTVAINTKRLKTIKERHGGMNNPVILAKKAETLYKHYGEGGPPQNHKYSATANKIGEMIESWGLEVIYEKALKTGQYLDITVPSKNFSLEYCGLYWHNEMSKSPRLRNYHISKMKAANAEGLRLMTLFEDEWKDNPDGVINLLKSILLPPETRLFARKCEVRMLDKKIAKAFLNKNHYQGSANSIYMAAGLFQGEELLGVMSMAKHHRQNHEHCLILSRMAFKMGVQIVGGAGRLLKFLLAQPEAATFTELISWSDNRYSEGHVYEAIGMTLTKELGPDYSYVMGGKDRRESKQAHRKVCTGCPKEITERDWELQHGNPRIWDCGKKVWTMPLLR